MKDERATPLELDHLVVGGGIQGLTLLDELVAAGARRVLLVSRDALGVGESLHSHGYLHRGYTLPPGSAALGREVRDCAAAWWERIARTGSPYLGQGPTHFGVAEQDLAERVGIWDELGLPYEALDAPPEALRGGAAAVGSVRHFRIEDRTLSMRELLADLAAPHQERIVHGELRGIELDASGRRVAACRLALGPDGARELVVRPRTLLLAAGRFAQPLLRGAATPDGRRPLDAPHRAFHRVRYVPMLLVRGRDLPPLTTVLASHALSVATHPMAGGESMWIVTSLLDHATDRGDFEEAREDAPGPALRRSLDLLRELVPAVRERMDADLRFGFYFGGKIDHPDGGNGRYVDDRGVENLRLLWPGLWSLALANAREVVEELRDAGEVRSGAAPLPDLGVPLGNPVGEELRLSGTRPWWTHAELAARLERS